MTTLYYKGDTMLPKDPHILLSVVNMKLRDYYHSLDDFCSSENISKEQLIHSLSKIDYKYNASNNQFH